MAGIVPTHALVITQTELQLKITNDLVQLITDGILKFPTRIEDYNTLQEAVYQIYEKIQVSLPNSMITLQEAVNQIFNESTPPQLDDAWERTTDDVNELSDEIDFFIIQRSIIPTLQLTMQSVHMRKTLNTQLTKDFVTRYTFPDEVRNRILNNMHTGNVINNRIIQCIEKALLQIEQLPNSLNDFTDIMNRRQETLDTIMADIETPIGRISDSLSLLQILDTLIDKIFDLPVISIDIINSIPQWNFLGRTYSHYTEWREVLNTIRARPRHYLSFKECRNVSNGLEMWNNLLRKKMTNDAILWKKSLDIFPESTPYRDLVLHNVETNNRLTTIIIQEIQAVRAQLGVLGASTRRKLDHMPVVTYTKVDKVLSLVPKFVQSCNL